MKAHNHQNSISKNQERNLYHFTLSYTELCYASQNLKIILFSIFPPEQCHKFHNFHNALILRYSLPLRSVDLKHH